MTRTSDPLDELAAMFLTSPQPMAPSMHADAANTWRAADVHQSSDVKSSSRPGEVEAAAGRAMIELLIVGNLPVRAGLWLTPYADAMAREAGSTALVRLDGEEPSVQVLRGPTEMASAPLDGSMQSALMQLGEAADLWIVRVPEGTPPGDLAGVGSDRITILSSADEAAVVAAYQILKDLAQAAEAMGKPLQSIGLAIVGADEAAAAGVIERLNRTTISFLGVEVQLVIALSRMDAGVISTRYEIFRDQRQPTVAEAVQWINAARSHAAGKRRPASHVVGRLHVDREAAHVVDAQRILKAVPTQPNTQPAPAPVAQLTPENARAAHAAASAPTHVEPLFPAPQASREPVMHAASSPRPVQERSDAEGATAPRPIKLAPRHVVEIEAKAPLHGDPREPDDCGQPVPLSRFVKGLSALPIRCPGHERIEFAVDAAGRMHLLAREHGLRDLKTAESWAKAHRELIAMACPQHRFDPTGKTVCHVFSDEPASLADLHGTDLRLHVLAPVEVNGHTGWYAAPLNTVAG